MLCERAIMRMGIPADIFVGSIPQWIADKW